MYVEVAVDKRSDESAVRGGLSSARKGMEGEWVVVFDDDDE